MPDMPIYERTVTGISLWLLREYLEELGAREDERGWLRGEGWQARLTPIEDYRIGSLSVGQVKLEMTGEEQAVERVRRALEPKLMRAGG